MQKVLINLLSKKAGRDVSTPCGSEWLCRDIEEVTGEKVSVNTVKRITGVLGEKGLHARRSTLDIIAIYLGYDNWLKLKVVLDESSSDFATPAGMIEMDELEKGSILKVCWDPEREIIIRHLGGGKYLVDKSCNSKLKVGDSLQLTQIMVGYPLFVKEVVRSGESLGSYTAAPEFGLSEVDLLTENYEME